MNEADTMPTPLTDEAMRLAGEQFGNDHSLMLGYMEGHGESMELRAAGFERVIATLTGEREADRKAWDDQVNTLLSQRQEAWNNAAVARRDLKTAEAANRTLVADTIERCAKVAEGGNFLHDDAPDARFGRACAAAIRILAASPADAPATGEQKWPDRTLFHSDPFCPCCGHNRDKSSVSSIDLGNDRKQCQMCQASWAEVDPLAAPADAPAPGGRAP